MAKAQKIESYLIHLGITYEEVGDNTWIVNDDEKGLEQVIILAEDPLVIIRVKVMDLPKKKQEEIFRTLLQFNASDLVHGAYALDGEDILLIDTLEYDTMDMEDFQASLDAIGLALSQHYHVLSDFRTKETKGA
jgi:hypothetical protein